MNVYVDKLPEDCLDCPCESEYYCNLLNTDVGCLRWGEKHKDCPLHSLADHTKQVRKEVCEYIGKNVTVDIINLKVYVKYDDLTNILDQIKENQNEYKI